MAIGLKEGRRRQRRKQRGALLKFAAAAIALVLLGFFAYETGTVFAQRETRSLREEVAELKDQMNSIDAENQNLKAQLRGAKGQVAEWSQRYEQDVPTGKAQELFRLLSASLENGVPASRLAFVIREAKASTECRNEPDDKRFILRTSGGRGQNNWVGFANTSIVVTGIGEPAVNGDGAPQAWFDPAKPVTITFTRVGGAKTDVKGLLPLSHGVVLGDTEYRFNVVTGPRGFVVVTGDRCKYP
jgi:cell division protein FtsB